MKENIRKLRTTKGITQKQLSRELGYETQSIIAMWESGERKPPSDKLPKIAKALNCKIEDLFAK